MKVRDRQANSATDSGACEKERYSRAAADCARVGGKERRGNKQKGVQEEWCGRRANEESRAQGISHGKAIIDLLL